MAEYYADGRTFFHQKEVIALLILFVVFCVSCIFAPITARAYNRTSAVLLMNADTGEILYEENADVKMEIASTTKILTAIAVIENADIFMTYTIPKEAVGVDGSSIYLQTGDKWRILDLLYGLILRSGNDAAVALAIATSGSVSEFASLMNRTAEKAGAVNSHFVNPHGLHDADHYSTARDLAKITAYAMKCPIFAEICGTKTHRCEIEKGLGREKVTFYNKNKLLYSYPRATGVKTGYTKYSGRCLVSAAEDGGVRLVCVALNVYDTYGISRGLFEKYFKELTERGS